MKTLKLIILSVIMCMTNQAAHSQWVVTDPGALAQSILNYVQHLSTVANTIEEVEESTKIFEQGKEYYDSLKNVHGLIKGSQKVKNCVNISVDLIQEYGKTKNKILSDSYYSAKQIDVFNRQQSSIMTSVAGVIADMNNIIVNTGMSLSDKERLDAIDTYYSRLQSLSNKSYRLNQQILGESVSVNQRKEQKRLERELLR